MPALTAPNFLKKIFLYFLKQLKLVSDTRFPRRLFQKLGQEKPFIPKLTFRKGSFINFWKPHGYTIITNGIENFMK